MTERLYMTDDSLATWARVRRCTQRDDGHFDVVLSATLFHPQGGGQLADRGTIADANVLRVVAVEDEVIHICDRAVVQSEVPIEVCGESRALHARLHSAGHLIGYCGDALGWRAVKGHHWPGEARVVFEANEGAPAFDADTVSAMANAYIAADLPRHMTWDGAKRVVGFGHLPAYGCGGTHVVSSAAVGAIRILKVKEKKGQLSVHYDVEDARP